MDTFVVRVWGPMADEEGETSLRGVVEHIASGRSDRFRTAAELVSFLRMPYPETPAATDGVPSASESLGSHRL
jgi:hypothetical protein